MLYYVICYYNKADKLVLFLQNNNLQKRMASSSSQLRYQDKVTIVTGGSKGIGEGIVREFGKAQVSPIAFN